MDKRRWTGGGFLLLAGTFFGRETGAYIWEGVLNLVSAGMGNSVTWSTFPWVNAAGVISFVAGVAVLSWPRLSGLWNRQKLDEGKVAQIVDDRLSQQPDLAAAIEAVRQQGERLTAIQQTCIAETKKLDEYARNGIATLDGQLKEQGTAFRGRLKFLERHRLSGEAKRLIEELESKRIPRPETGSEIGRGPYPDLGKDHTLRASVIALGVPEDKFQSDIDGAEKFVVSDRQSSFITSVDAKGVWKDADEKRAWNTYNEQISALIRLLRNFEQRLWVCD